MAKQTINIGASPNDGTGTPLRTAFDYTNQNFTELYTATGPSGNNIVVPGSATITGALTVRTTGLTVNSSGVGVGLTAALGAGNIQIGAGKYLGYSASAYITPEDNVQGARIKADNILIDGNTSTKWNIGGSTAMTLNSTGLGVGVSPSYKLHVQGTGAVVGMLATTNANGPYVIFQNSTANFGDIGSELAITGGGSAGNMTINSRLSSNLCLAVSDSVKMRIDSSGNVGVGVTPSAWGSGYKVIQGQIGGFALSNDNSSNNQFRLSSNAYFDTTDSRWEYYGSSTATAYEQRAGEHRFFNAASGTANNAITFTQAMTLDASGNLLVGTTGLPVSNGRISASSSSSVTPIRAYTSAGDIYPSIIADKSSATNTTAQVFVAFTVNNQATGSGQINANGASQAAFGTFSDSRLKENIVSLPSQLANILSLRPVEFDYKDGSGHQIGFVAQEIQEVYSDTVGEQNGFLTVTGWSKTEARLVSAIKELAAKVQALEAKLA